MGPLRLTHPTKLMWEFPRAAMNVELKCGRKAVTRFLEERRFCDRLGIDIIEADIPDLLAAAGFGADLPTASE